MPSTATVRISVRRLPRVKKPRRKIENPMKMTAKSRATISCWSNATPRSLARDSPLFEAPTATSMERCSIVSSLRQPGCLSRLQARNLFPAPALLPGDASAPFFGSGKSTPRRQRCAGSMPTVPALRGPIGELGERRLGPGFDVRLIVPWPDLPDRRRTNLPQSATPAELSARRPHNSKTELLWPV